MAMLLHHASTPPLPPSARTELSIPKALDQLVLSCLAKDPGGRPQSAKELLRRLTDVAGALTWTEDRARDWWAMHQPTTSGREPSAPGLSGRGETSIACSIEAT
jgi:hypothetical protein